MGEIFISYKRERRAAAEHLATILRCYGYEVWFDYSLVKGINFDQQIEEKIRSAKVCIVLWCTRSTASKWVHQETNLAEGLGILLPVKIEACELPISQRLKHYVDLSSWDGTPRSHLLDDLLSEVGGLVERSPSLTFSKLSEYEAIWRRFGAQSLQSFALDDMPTKAPDKNLVVLSELWAEIKESRSLERLRRFREQVVGTPIEIAVEERIELLVESFNPDLVADWIKRATQPLRVIKSVYSIPAYKSDKGESYAANKANEFEKRIVLAFKQLPHIDEGVDLQKIIPFLTDHIETENVLNGQPVPDSFRYDMIFPERSDIWGKDERVVRACLRPGLKCTCTVRRQHEGYLRQGMVVEPLVTFVD